MLFFKMSLYPLLTVILYHSTVSECIIHYQNQSATEKYFDTTELLNELLVNYIPTDRPG